MRSTPEDSYRFENQLIVVQRHPTLLRQSHLLEAMFEVGGM